MLRGRPWIAGLAMALVTFAGGLADLVRSGTLRTAQGADAPAYVRIAETLLATGRAELPGPGSLRPAPQERLDDVFGSPLSRTVDGRFFPKHPVLFGALLVPGVALGGVAGARVTALLLGALLAGLATAAAARRFGAWPALLAVSAILLLSPGGRNVLWGINVDTPIALLWLAALLLADGGRPLAAGVAGGLLLFLRLPAALLLAGPAALLASRPRRELLRAAAGLLPLAGALLALNAALWRAPWRTAYDRVVVVSGGAISLARHSDQFTLPPLEGLGILLLDPSGGLAATAPAALVGLAGLLLPAGRSRLSAAAVLSAAAWLLLLTTYSFLAQVPGTAYRFALPLLVASVLPLAALLAEANRLRRAGPEG